MRFNLNNKWAVITEEQQVCIAMRKISKSEKSDGEEYLSPTYYYNNFEEALKGLIDRDIQGLEKLSEVEGRISDLKNDMRLLIKKARLTL